MTTTTQHAVDAPGPETTRSPEHYQAEAIGDVCALAATVSDPVRRGELLAVAQRALATTQGHTHAELADDPFFVAAISPHGAVGLYANQAVVLPTAADTREAARQAAAVSRRLLQLAEQQETAVAPTAPCPDGVLFCTGAADSHADPREHAHRGPAHTMNGTYGSDILSIQLIQWNDEQPCLSFADAGACDELDLEQVRELDADLLKHHVRLKDELRRLAILTTDRRYGRTTSPDDLREDLPDAAFAICLDAMQITLDTAADRDRTVLALRTVLAMATEESR